ncbi:MAG: GNAT family N-acetyltransferase [Oscillospiraceae bacterium]|nr:GNAT family N-acetyltransferase [Oscillospiraceae bacterium]
MNAEIDCSNVVLTTRRLTLRPWRPEDLEDLYRYASVDGVGQMAGWKPHESREASRRILESFIAGKKTFALEREGRVVGSLGVERYREDQFPAFADKRCRELGFVLAKDCWGQGLMPEAVDEVLRWLFEEKSLDAVFCGHFDWNRQSARVQEKCGFRPFARAAFTTHLGTTETETVNLLTRDEWLRRRAEETEAGR